MQLLKKIIFYILNPVGFSAKFISKSLEMNFAEKYMFSFRRSFNFITVITILSCIGITIGIAALISVLGIFNGFQDFSEKQLVSFDPHVRILPLRGDTISNYEQLISKMKNLNNITGISPLSQKRVVIRKNESMQVTLLNSIDTKTFSSVSGINKCMVAGQFKLLQADDNIPGIIVGAGLAEKLNLYISDTIYVLTPEAIENSVRTMQEGEQTPFRVIGVFQTQSKEYDELYSYIFMDPNSPIFQYNANQCGMLDIRINDWNKSNDMKEKLQAEFPNYKVVSWFDLHEEIFNVMKLERLAVFIVLSLIIIIAVFNLLASLSMTVIEKRSDIALLKSIGIANKSIYKIFIYQGLIIGLTSMIYGTILGLAFCYAQIHFKLFRIDTSKYLLDAIPVSINYISIIAVDVFAIVLSFLATIFPASKAVKYPVTEGLKEDN